MPLSQPPGASAPRQRGSLQSLHPAGCMGRVDAVGHGARVPAWRGVTRCSPHPEPRQVSDGRERSAAGTGGFLVTLLPFRAEAGVLESPGGAPRGPPQDAPLTYLTAY